MELITIQDCPLCNQCHKYNLHVDRTIVVKHINIGDLFEKERRVRITRLFYCPNKNQKYQATIILLDTSSDRITSVGEAEINNDTK